MLIALFRDHEGDPLSWIISALTRGGYVHASLWDEKQKLLIEAYYPAIRIRKLGDGEAAGIDFFSIEGLTPLQCTGIDQYATEAIGAKAHYSIANLFRFLPMFRPLMGEARDTGDTSSVFCSQFVADCLERGANFPLLRANSWEIAPSQLAWSPFLRQTTIDGPTP